MVIHTGLQPEEEERDRQKLEEDGDSGGVRLFSLCFSEEIWAYLNANEKDVNQEGFIQTDQALGLHGLYVYVFSM